jgi:glyoxylase I family protein
MIKLSGIHHIAIICSDYQRSKDFYINILGLHLVREIYREQRQSYKADLALNGKYVIELFSFPHPPKRLSQPEGTGLRHLAFEVEDITATVKYLQQKNIVAEPVRVDETTGKRFTFIADPDLLPIEFYEV